MSSPPDRSTQLGVISRLKQGKEILEIVVWIVSGVSAIHAFLTSVGGWVQFLVEVGAYGFACYIAAWVVLPIVIAALGGLERVANRETSDVAVGIVAGVTILGGGALFRWGLFHPGFTEDLDTIGTAFSATLGIVVLAIPFIVLWYLRGSKARAA